MQQMKGEKEVNNSRSDSKQNLSSSYMGVGVRKNSFM